MKTVRVMGTIHMVMGGEMVVVTLDVDLISCTCGKLLGIVGNVDVMVIKEDPMMGYMRMMDELLAEPYSGYDSPLSDYPGPNKKRSPFSVPGDGMGALDSAEDVAIGAAEKVKQIAPTVVQEESSTAIDDTAVAESDVPVAESDVPVAATETSDEGAVEEKAEGDANPNDDDSSGSSSGGNETTTEEE